MSPIRTGSCRILDMQVIHAPPRIGSGRGSWREAFLAERVVLGYPSGQWEIQGSSII